jgi:hypothetical protein
MAVPKKVIATGVATAALVGLAFAGTTLASNANVGLHRPDGNRTPLTAEQRAARETEMKTKMNDLLTKAVTDGKLTADQKAHILAVQDQIHTKMEAGDRTGANKLRDELHTWTKDQGIDQSIFPAGRGRGMGPKDGKGPHGPRLDK